MKKQFTKFKIAAGNLSRSNKSDKDKDLELEMIEKQVDKYRNVLEKMVRKLPTVSSTTDAQERDKRIKKNSHYKIGQALEESSKELSKELPLHHVLFNCGELEKTVAECIVDSELETETEVVRRLKLILDNEIQDISTLKRNVSRTLQEYASLKRNLEAAMRSDEPQTKVNHIREQLEQCELKLEKERDAWAAQMFELIAKEDVIVHCIRDYVLNQRNYHERALQRVNSSLANIQDTIQSTVKSRFGTSLADHLASTNREISYIIELCVCCLVESGLYEEGLLRVGCASTKLRRMKHALEAQYVKTPLPLEYQDPHVIGSILKLYLRELPEPLLTYKYYKDFIRAAERNTEAERKADIKAALAKLPRENFANLRYLTRFLWLIMQNVDYNKMNSQNLSIVMSPNMLWPRVDKSNPADYLGQVNCSSAANIIVELLISQWEYFFEGEVDFFITLQRHKLFMEGKSKSNSSNENLDKHDADSLESPRYGTIRRQKACAPSPPTKTATPYTPHNVNSIPHADDPPEMIAQKNGDVNHRDRGKELFPTGGDKPEKPPLPKVPQFQQLYMHQSAQEQPSPKPVPMTRTQFFGLDNLPSPVADRKSSDSVNSLTFKPDLPQKPKIPKRPMVLGLSGTGSNKSDEETTPTSSQPNLCGNTNSNSNNSNNSAVTAAVNCDSNATTTTTLALTTPTLTATSASNTNNKEHNHNQHFLYAERTAAHNNANANESNFNSITAHTATTNANSNFNSNSNSNSNVNSNSNSSNNSNTNSNANNLSATDNNSSGSNNSKSSGTSDLRITPTTPISPNMILTPKRPTVPAPPPPSVVKKQTD